MTHQMCRWLMVLLICALAPVAVTAEEASQSKKAESAATREVPAGAAQPVPVYKPPLRGKPRARIGGGVRSATADWPSLFVLVPEHTGQTISAQPSPMAPARRKASSRTDSPTCELHAPGALPRP